MRSTGLVDPEVKIRPARTQVGDVLSKIRRCVEHDERVRYLHADVETVERVATLDVDAEGFLPSEGA